MILLFLITNYRTLHHNEHNQQTKRHHHRKLGGRVNQFRQQRCTHSLHTQCR